MFRPGDPAIYIGPDKANYGEMVFIVDGPKMFYFRDVAGNPGSTQNIRRLAYKIKDCFGEGRSSNGLGSWIAEPHHLKPIDNDQFEQERIAELNLPRSTARQAEEH